MTKTQLQKTAALFLVLCVGLCAPALAADNVGGPELARQLETVMDDNHPSSAERYNRDVTALVCPGLDRETFEGLLSAQGWSIDRQHDARAVDYVLRPPFRIANFLAYVFATQDTYLVVTFDTQDTCEARVRMSFL